MIFPDRVQVRGTQTRFLSLVPLTMHGPIDSAEFLMLFDFGLNAVVGLVGV